MGEVVVSSEGGMELGAQETEVETEMAQKAEEEGSSMVRWERFLPKMAVRVLLVEADDSTRQIITALLRKCSYKVAAVSDGLKAWEVLKGKPHNIDLILTEVELPSISGYALLTLIMEHEVCKNIPIIMMSSHDSVSTVYKCMLRGATDFLVKPVRKNELRNLWQHVWRKQASSIAVGPGPPNESVPRSNNAISNHSSDAQSSCTKPETETEGEDNKDVLHCPSQPRSGKCVSNDINTPAQEECHQESRKRRALDNGTGDNAITRDDAQKQVNFIAQNSENDCVLENNCREAIDLIGAFDNHPKVGFGSSASNFTTSKFDSLHPLDLSLRGSNPSSVNQVNDERAKLNHSDASAFSRYIHKPSHNASHHETNSEKQMSNHTLDCNSDTHNPIMQHVSMSTVQMGKPEITLHYSQNREISHPIPVRCVRYENAINSSGSMMPLPYRAQSGPSPSPSAPHHTESFPQSENIDQIENKQGKKSENTEDRENVSPVNDQSGNSSYCNGNGKISGISAVKATSESCNDESYRFLDGAPHRSTQREAALMKFRMKRKDRCFDKKVRYESRKKLAENRPRIKGQFVRQATNDLQTSNSSAC